MNRRRFLSLLSGVLAALPFGWLWAKPGSEHSILTAGSSTTWAVVDNDFGDIVSTWAEFDSPDQVSIYAAGPNGAVFVTDDQGATWTEVKAGDALDI